jgi:predicted Zn-ribbon and HTH transcriptional regulator
MPSHLDTLQIPVTCPKCSHEFTKTFRELKVNTNLGCPKCGQDFNAGDLNPPCKRLRSRSMTSCDKPADWASNESIKIPGGHANRRQQLLLIFTRRKYHEWSRSAPSQYITRRSESAQGFEILFALDRNFTTRWLRWYRVASANRHCRSYPCRSYGPYI